jgi:hypothetical protein
MQNPSWSRRNPRPILALFPPRLAFLFGVFSVFLSWLCGTVSLFLCWRSLILAWATGTSILVAFVIRLVFCVRLFCVGFCEWSLSLGYGTPDPQRVSQKRFSYLKQNLFHEQLF